MFENILSEVETFKALVMVQNTSTSECKCSTKFSNSALRKMNKKGLEDIHGFSEDLITNLSWKCPQTGQTSKGCFYGKHSPTNSNPLYDQVDIISSVGKSGPESVDFTYKGDTQSDLTLVNMVACGVQMIFYIGSNACTIYKYLSLIYRDS